MLLMAYSVAFGNSTSGSVAEWAVGRQSLTPEQVCLLSSMVAVSTPGATVAGACIESFERRMNGPLARLLPAIQQGLAAVDAACVQKTGSGILDLTPMERGKFIRELRSGHKLTAFFRMVTSTCSLSHLSS